MAASAPKFSLSLAGPKRPAAANGVKRPHAALAEDEEPEEVIGRKEEVSHFGANGAVSVAKKEEKAPLVIQKLENKNWRQVAQAKRQKSGIPQAPAKHETSGTTDVVNADKPAYGLTVTKKASAGLIEGLGVPPFENGNEPKAPQAAQPEVNPDQEAINALLGNKPKSNMVIAATEEEALQNDMASAPDMASLDDYARVPIEEFGAAMLRGMGWDGGEIGKNRGNNPAKPRILERRPNLLGLGAKDAAATGVELGAWGKGVKRDRQKEKIYNPVMLRNKATGEMYTEEELEKRKQEALNVKDAPSREVSRSTRHDDIEARRSGMDRKNDDDSSEEERRRRRRHRQKEEARDEERRHRHRSRSRSPGRHSSKRSYHDRDGDRDRERRRHRSKDRESDRRRKDKY